MATTFLEIQILENFIPFLVLAFDHLRRNVEMRNLERVRFYITFIFELEEKEICSNDREYKIFREHFWIFE